MYYSLNTLDRSTDVKKKLLDFILSKQDVANICVGNQSSLMDTYVLAISAYKKIRAIH